MGTFAEAIRSMFVACNLGVVLTGAACVLASRGSLRVVGAVIASALVGGWMFAQDVPIPLSDVGGTASHIVVLAAACVAVALLGGRRWWAAALAGGAELAATIWWVPCVGAALGSVLNDPRFAAQAIPMALYMLGLLVPVLVIAAGFGLINMPSATGE